MRFESSERRGFRNSVLLAFVLLVVFRVVAVPASSEAAEPSPQNQNAVWVAESNGVLKVGTADGTALAVAPGVSNARAVAIDPTRLRAWVFAGGSLHAIDFSGHELFSVSAGAADSEHAQLAVNIEDGSVWLAVNRDVRSFGAEGQAFLAVTSPSNVRALAVDAATGEVWIGMASGVIAYDAVSGFEIRSLELGPSETLVHMAVAPAGEGLWVALKDRLRRLTPEGARLWETSAPGISLVAADSRGGAWAAAGKDVMHFAGGGQVGVDLRPLGQQAVLSSLAVDASNDDAWVANNGGLAQVSTDGSMKRSIALAPGLHVWDLAVYADLIPPTLRIESPTNASILNRNIPEILVALSDAGSGADPSTLAFLVNDVAREAQCAPIATGASCLLLSPLPDGAILLSATVRDRAGNLSEPATVTFLVDTTPPTVEIVSPLPGSVLDIDTPEISISFADDGTAVNASSLAVLVNGSPALCAPSGDSATCTPSAPLPEGDVLVLATVRDVAGNQSTPATSMFRIELTGGLPPDPASVAPPVDPTVPTDIARSTEFLYAGPRPIQTGVAEGVIDARRVAIVRGRVLDQGGNALSGVTVSIHGHEELGSTLTRLDGMFDLAANGGGLLIVDYAADGYLPAQRPVQTGWRDFETAEDVVLIALDANAAPITFGADEMQQARGPVVEDADGRRQATLLVAAGTLGELVYSDGFRESLPSMTVRATEYSVGPQGPQAMPGRLPASTAYTYAVELSADEAIASGAVRVEFSKPAIFYAENFLDFPIGDVVPVGYYDREEASWIPSENGRVVRVLGVAAGLADLDIDGSGRTASAAELAAAGITTEERSKLAEIYAPGVSLWRVPIPHFSPWDCNWPSSPPVDAKYPPSPDYNAPDVDDIDATEPDPEVDQDAPADDESDSCEVPGSIIECENQVLRQDVPLVGVPWALHYRSSRMPGHRVSSSLKIRLSGRTVPSSLKRIDLEVEVAGQRLLRSFAPAARQTYTFDWNGRDAYGRPVVGHEPVSVTVSFVYDLVRWTPQQVQRAFGLTFLPTAQPVGNSGRGEISYSKSVSQTLVGRQGLIQDVAGWSVTPHLLYDPNDGTLHGGDGKDWNARLALASGSVLATAINAQGAEDIQTGPDGVLYYGEQRVFGGTTLWALSPPLRPGSLRRLLELGSGIAVRGVAVEESGTVYYTTGGCASLGSPLPSPPAQVMRFNPGPPPTPSLMSKAAPVAILTGSMYDCYTDVEHAADGSILVTANRSRILRIARDGGVAVAAGGGTSNANGTPAAGAAIEPSYLAAASDGSIYFTEPFANRVRRISPSGILETVAGSGTRGFRGDGGDARLAQLDQPANLAIAPSGSLVIADTGNKRVRAVTAGGIIVTIAGTGVIGPNPPDGGPAQAAGLWAAGATSVAPDGRVAVFDGSSIRMLEPASPGFAVGAVSQPSPDGTELADFDETMRHIRTRDSLTGATRVSFEYDSAGRLVGIADASGRWSRIERGANGVPLAVVAPEGHRTALVVGATGYLEAATNPANETTRYGYTSDGLMKWKVDPKLNRTDYSFSPKGRLIGTQDAAGGSRTFVRSVAPRRYQVALRSARGTTTTYKDEGTATGDNIRRIVSTSGLLSTRVENAAGGVAITHANGTISRIAYGPDPRFGMDVPLIMSADVATPSGLRWVMSTSRSAMLSDPADPASLISLLDSISTNGRTATRLFDRASMTLVTTSPEGRILRESLDSLGRLVRREEPGVLPATWSYDEKGRLFAVTQGLRRTSYEFDPAGRTSTIRDPLNREAHFSYDAVGRVTRQQLPGSRDIEFVYDKNGNLAAVRPPSRPAHEFEYTPLDQPAEYAPPDVGLTGRRTLWSYNSDHQLDLITRPNGQAIDPVYGPTGRPESVATPNGSYAFSYDPASGQLAAVSGPEGGTLRFGYDGPLPTSIAWEGPVAGAVQFVYDSSFQVVGRSVNGANAFAFAYDRDGLLTAVGHLSLRRGTATGFLDGTTLGTTSDGRTFSPYGEFDTYSATVGGAPIFGFDLDLDDDGRIIKKTETIGGVTEEWEYRYDTAGRLDEVKRGGVVVESYAYDSNSNRERWSDFWGSGAATYDSQDRLVSAGESTYAFTPNGELAVRTSGPEVTTYSYDALGNLRRVTLPTGIELEYLIDAANRRIGKKVDGTLVQGLLWESDLRPAAEIDGAGNVVSLFVYGTRPNVPDYMARAGIEYRFFTDHLGSVRLVVNSTNGSVAQRIDYDAFGRVTLDTNPGFQPFGFAGGLYDSQTGLVRFGARDYDPRAGRWTSADPILFDGRDANLYAYAFGDPVNLFDPSGLDAITSDPTVRQHFYNLWRDSGYGRRNTEKAGWITHDPASGEYGCTKWPWSAKDRQETWKGPIPKDMVALAHTHPDTTSPEPSTGTTDGKKRDDAAAAESKAPVYTISRKGIWKIDPSGTITQEEGPDWTNGLNKKECKGCQ